MQLEPASAAPAAAFGNVKRMKGLISPPTFCPATVLEHTIHKPPRMLRADIELVFRPDLATAFARESPAGAHEDVDSWLAERLLAVPTWQPAEHDLSEISFPVNEERRGKLANFQTWVTAVRARLGDWWSDASDPLEGTALFGARTSCIYNELEGLTSLLRYDSVPIGCCGIVLHPAWRRKAYPVTFFTTAPLEVLQAALAGAEAERAGAKAAEGRPAAAASEEEEEAATGLEAAVERLGLGAPAEEPPLVCALPRGGGVARAADAESELRAERDADGGELVSVDATHVGWLAEAGQLTLRTTAAVHFDQFNLMLLGALQPAVRPGAAVLYPCCGSGVLGLLALRAGAASVHFTDVLPAAVDLAAANARAAGFRQGKHWTAAVEDLGCGTDGGSGDANGGDANGGNANGGNASGGNANGGNANGGNANGGNANGGGANGGAGGGGGAGGMQFDLLLCNPPQLAGPPAMAQSCPDRYAGADGLAYYRALAAMLGALREGGRAALLQTSLSSFAALDDLFARAGLPPSTLASQPRVAQAAAFEALAPGTLGRLLELRAQGGAAFELVDAAGAPLPPREGAAAPSEAELQATVCYTQRLVLCG